MTDTARDLEIARELTRHGIPVFAAPPADTTVGFALPANWQQTPADPRRVDEWKPGWALCMVCGHGLDLIDIDIYNGGSVEAVELALKGQMPRAYAMAATPSGGVHLFVSALNVRSKNDALKGVDIKSGEASGKGRGFAFIAPTEKPSKMTGQKGKYTWVRY